MTSQTKCAALSEFISGLEVDAAGSVRLGDWKGTTLEESALRLLPEARSVVVFAMEIYREILDLAAPGRVTGEAALIDLVTANADFLYGRLTKAAYDVAKASRMLGFKALPLPASGCPTDTRFLRAVFSYKHAAEAAGLGTIGKNSLLITSDRGPRVRLACCLTEAELEPTKAAKPWKCAGCRICIDKCPAGALSEPEPGERYAINKYACSSFRTAGGGCVECLRLCPAGPPRKRTLVA